MIRLKKNKPIERSVGFLEVCHSGDVHRVVIRRASSARRFTLRIRAAARDVVLTMPVRSKIDDARKFAEQHAAWIGARIKRLPAPVPFADGSVIPLRGVKHSIVHCVNARGTVWIETADPHQEQALSKICVAGGHAYIERRLLDFLKQQAKSDLTEAVSRHCANLGVTARRVSLRDTSSRWGSCSASGNLNFSWRLILAPGYVLDYLAAHEVAHLRHLNHSPRFWALARSLCTHTDAAEAWLSVQGMHLHRYGKPA